MPVVHGEYKTAADCRSMRAVSLLIPNAIPKPRAYTALYLAPTSSNPIFLILAAARQLRRAAVPRLSDPLQGARPKGELMRSRRHEAQHYRRPALGCLWRCCLQERFMGLTARTPMSAARRRPQHDSFEDATLSMRNLRIRLDQFGVWKCPVLASSRTLLIEAVLIPGSGSPLVPCGGLRDVRI